MKFKQGDVAQFVMTGCEDLEGKITTICGIAQKFPEMAIYIVRDPRLNSKWSHMIMTEHCLDFWIP